MGTVSLTLPSDGQTIDASDVNNPLNTLAAEINGQLDNSNIKSGAAIDRSKIAGFTDGWESLGYAPTTITALGNRSYTVVIPSVDTTTATSPGQRLKLPRTVTAPTQSANLNGTTQYFSKSSPSGMTFIDDFVVSAWVKLSAYPASNGLIASRYNGTSGWDLSIAPTGQVQLAGRNGAATNYRLVNSYQSIPLNRWVHITAQLDMSAYTLSATTCYVMIDGVDVPAALGQGGTNPTALVQAGNLEIGSWNGGLLPINGKISQLAIYNAKVTQATILASMNQTLTGSETSLVSAYKLDQASGLNDLSANANNLTAQGSPSYSTTQTPFTNPVTGTSVTAGTTNYGIIMAQTFSTNTTYTIQIPEGETLPTTGGIGTVSYSTQKTPYGFPGQSEKWTINCLQLATMSNIGISSITVWQGGIIGLTIPVGSWKIGYQGSVRFDSSASGVRSGFVTISSTTPTTAVYNQTLTSRNATAAATFLIASWQKSDYISLSAATLYSLYGAIDAATGTETFRPNGAEGAFIIYAENALL